MRASRPCPGWPFCIAPDDANPQPQPPSQLTGSGGFVTWSNLTTPGDYIVTEANANESNWFHSTAATSLIVFPAGAELRRGRSATTARRRVVG